MKLAYFSPLPPTRSGIADHSAELLPHLSPYADITLFVDDVAQVDERLKAQFAVRPLTAYPDEQWQYDLPLYHMGNSSFHDAIYRMSVHYPGLVVLHELGLHHFIAHRTMGQDDRAGYARELGYAQATANPDRLRQLHPDDLYNVPLNNRLVDASLGIILHSRYAQRKVVALRPSLPTSIIPELMTLQTGQPHERAEMLAPDNALVFASLGQVTPHKQMELALHAFKQLRQSHPHGRYLIVGEITPESGLQSLIATLELEDAVYATGHVAQLSEFVNWLLLADVVINLRHPTLGETSAAALRAMGAGKPLIVFDQGWYSELPDGAARKIAPMDEAALLIAMRQLADEPELRQEMGRIAQQTIHEQCAPDKVAAAYVGFIRQLVAHYGGTHV